MKQETKEASYGLLIVGAVLSYAGAVLSTVLYIINLP